MMQWRCTVCGYVHNGNKPPKECPQCSSGYKDFIENKPIKKLSYDGKKFDVLLINGSSHKSHNTSYLLDLAEAELKRKKISYRRFNLSELQIYHCWCCYSLEDKACTYPCRNQLDDAPALHEMMVDSKAIIVASPINWNNMSARLKDFLDRTTCLQNLGLLKKDSLTVNKALGILINGHEDGALKTALDIYVYFQQMGYIFAPFSFAYITHWAIHNADTDNEYLKTSEKLKRDVSGVVNNVVELMKLDLEKKLKNKIKSICE